MIQATGRSAAEAPEAGAGRAWALLEVIAFSALVLGLGPLVAEIGAPPFLTFVANPLILGCVWFTFLWARRQRGGDRGSAPERAAPQVWSAGRTALVCLAATLLFFAFKLFVSPAFDGLAETYLGGDRLAQTREYAFLRGDPEAFAQWLALIWLFAALGEEVFFGGCFLVDLKQLSATGLQLVFLLLLSKRRHSHFTILRAVLWRWCRASRADFIWAYVMFWRDAACCRSSSPTDCGTLLA